MAQPIPLRTTARTHEHEHDLNLNLNLNHVSTQELYRELLSRFHEDPTRDGLLDTPRRMEKAMAHLTKGYTEDPAKILRGALFDVDYDEMVIVRDIEFFSMCEHHLLPFYGRAHIAYIPTARLWA